MERIRRMSRRAWAGMVVAGGVVAAAIVVPVVLLGGGEEARVDTPRAALSMETCLAFVGSGETVPEGGPCLVVVSDGSPDSLLLEWVGGPDDATGWQYRRTRWDSAESRQAPWGAWQEVPGSDSATHAYRLDGLTSSTGHRFEVRAVVDGVAGPPSNLDGGITHEPGRLPALYAGNIVEGDGRTEWQLGSFVFTIPEGLRLVGGLTWASDGDSGTAVYDFNGRGSLNFIHTQGVVRPHIQDGLSAGARLRFQVLLNALVDSVRVLPGE